LRKGVDDTGMNERTSIHGYTLVELLIVIGIMLTIAGMSVYAVTMFLKEDKLAYEGTKIELLMRRLREEAHTTRIDRRVIFDFVRRSMIVYRAGDDNTFGSLNAPKLGAENPLEEVFLDQGMWFEKAIMKASDYGGGKPFFPEDMGGEPPRLVDHPDARTGCLTFKRDGTITIGTIIPSSGVVTQEVDISTSDWDAGTDADIIIAMRGEARRLLIDVRSLAGAVRSRVGMMSGGK